MDTETWWVIDSNNVLKTITNTGTVVKTYADKAVEVAAKKGEGSIFHINNAEFAAKDGAVQRTSSHYCDSVKKETYIYS